MAMPNKIAEGIPFSDVANLLEKVTNTKIGTKKVAYIEKFFDEGRKFFKGIHGNSLESEKADGDSLFSIVRILLPMDDRSRPAYGIRAAVLGRIFAKVLALDKNSVDGKRLINFKNPGKAGAAAGNFGAVVYSVLETRFSNNTSKLGPTMSELHIVLDQLARDGNVTQEAQTRILQGFIRKITPLEGKWLSRILLKSVQLGLSSTQIFKIIHPKAKEMYDKTRDLEKVCQTLNDPSLEIEIPAVTLFSHCGSMLCTRMTVVDDGFQEDMDDDEGPKTTTKPKKDPVTLPSPPFIVETKWDGERFQIHYDGTELKYLSRRGFDFTKSFGKTLSPNFRPLIKSGVESFVLDGEMMAWNKKTKTFTQKGGQVDVKTINQKNRNHSPTFVAFDIMYFNGNIIVDETLIKRMEILKQVITPKEGVVLITEQKLMNCKEQVLDALNEAIDNLEEGLIVKDINSTYVPSRTIAWLKIKPEYIDGTSVDDLDLLILGANYSDSVRSGGTIGNFLVGIVDQSGPKEMFFPVTTVGSGKLRNEQMNALIEELEPRFGRTEFPNVMYKGQRGKRPDLFINPQNSIVVQVKASEITSSDTNAVEYTIRFPRIVQVRRDKSYNEAMSVEEFHRLRISCGGKLAKRTDGKGAPYRKRRNSSQDEDEPYRKRQGLLPLEEDSDDDADDENDMQEPQPGPSNYRKSKNLVNKTLPPLAKLPLATTSKEPEPAPVYENIFKKKVFCVYGTASWKSKMEKDIKNYGGEIVQNPVKDKFWIVGEKAEHIKVEKAIKSGRYDVLKPTWVFRCIEKKKEVKLSPSYLFQYTEITGEQFIGKYDEFGDSYTKPLGWDTGRELYKKVMSIMDNEEEEEIEDMDIDELNQELFPELDTRHKNRFVFLKGAKIAFRDCSDPILKFKAEFYGAIVTEDETEEGVTQVIAESASSPGKKNHLRAMVVKPRWLEDSCKRREWLMEVSYQI